LEQVEMTLKIRNEQMESFAASAYQDFEERMTRHLKKFFPETMNEMAPNEIREFIGACVKGAAQYGLTSEQAVACFTHLPLLLGPDFETDPNWRFAPTVLSSHECHPNERAKLAMLLAHALKARGL
jgi:hypothetical protein